MTKKLAFGIWILYISTMKALELYEILHKYLALKESGWTTYNVADAHYERAINNNLYWLNNNTGEAYWFVIEQFYTLETGSACAAYWNVTNETKQQYITALTNAGLDFHTVMDFIDKF